MSPKKQAKSTCPECGRTAHTIIAGKCRACKTEK